MRTLKASSTKTFTGPTVLRRASLLALALGVFLFASVASAMAAAITITGAGTGSGVVNVTGATKGTLINCTITAGVTSGTCSATFGLAEIDTVTVAPSTGSIFAQWSSSTGGASNTCKETANPCTLRATTASALTAELEKPAVWAVTTDAASNITAGGAKLNGSLQPEGTAAEYFFEYGTTTAYEHSTTAKISSSGGEVLLSEVLSGLALFTTYHYRIVAKRVIEGTPRESVGKDEIFATLGISPEVQSESASAITPFSARLEATINLEGYPVTSYYFVYGTSPTSEQASMPVAIASGSGSVQVNPRVLQALQPETTYYYHVVAENTFGKVEGPDGQEEGTFTTLPASAPEVSLGPVGEVGQTSASVSATVNANGLATEYEIELGLSGAYTPVAAQSAGDGAIPQTDSYGLSGLAPGTSYELRVVAWNEAGEATSSVQSFTTAASSTPVFVQPVTPVLLATPALVEAKEPALQTTTKKTLTKAQKLAKALKACKKKAKGKRAACEKQAHKKYAPATKKKKR